MNNAIKDMMLYMKAKEKRAAKALEQLTDSLERVSSSLGETACCAGPVDFRDTTSESRSRLPW